MMNFATYSKWMRSLVVGTSFFVTGSAYSQDEVQTITATCQASLRQLVFWCVTAHQAEESVVTPIEQESKCEKAKQLVDGHCYPVQVPQLACNSALKEMEVWCGGKSKFNVMAVVEYCDQSQRNIRLFCYQ